MLNEANLVPGGQSYWIWFHPKYKHEMVKTNCTYHLMGVHYENIVANLTVALNQSLNKVPVTLGVSLISYHCLNVSHCLLGVSFTLHQCNPTKTVWRLRLKMQVFNAWQVRLKTWQRQLLLYKSQILANTKHCHVLSKAIYNVQMHCGIQFILHGMIYIFSSIWGPFY